MDPSEDLLELSVEEIAKQLGIEDYVPVRHAGVATSRFTGQMNITENVGITTMRPSYAQALSKKEKTDSIRPLSPEKVANKLEDCIPIRYARVATSQSTGQINTVENVGITKLQPSCAQVVSKRENTDATQPPSPKKIANQLEDIIQVGNGEVLTSQSAAGQIINVENIEAVTKLRSVKNVGIVTSPSRKPDITESAKDPLTSSTRSNEIGTSQYEDEMNAKNQGELATSGSKVGASLEKNQEMRKSRNRKKKEKNGGGQMSSTLSAQKKIVKQLEGHHVDIEKPGFTSLQPTGQRNVEKLRVVALPSEGHVTEENAEITTSNSETRGIIESEVENSPRNSLIRNLETEISPQLTNNIYWTIAHLEDEMNPENQGNTASESIDKLALLEIKPKRKNPKNYKIKTQKLGNGAGSSRVNTPSNRCCSNRNIALLATLTCILWLAPFVEGAHLEVSRFSWQILAAISVALI